MLRHAHFIVGHLEKVADEHETVSIYANPGTEIPPKTPTATSTWEPVDLTSLAQFTVRINLSVFIEAPDLTSYAVRSATGSLTTQTWTSFADTGEAGVGWREANPTANHIAELNLENASTLTNGTLINLGNIFSPAQSKICCSNTPRWLVSCCAELCNTDRLRRQQTSQATATATDKSTQVISPA